jgi:hypothetical protein
VLTTLLFGRPMPAQEVPVQCEWNSFKALDIRDKHHALKVCRPDRRIDLFVRWSYATYPPNGDLSETMAAFGVDMIPAILERIERSGSFFEEGTKSDVVHLLVLMHIRGYYAAGEDHVVLQRVNDAVERIPDELMRDEARDALNELRSAKFGSRPLQ